MTWYKKERHPLLDAALAKAFILPYFCELLCIRKEGFPIELDIPSNLSVLETELQHPVHHGTTQKHNVCGKDGRITTSCLSFFAVPFAVGHPLDLLHESAMELLKVVEGSSGILFQASELDLI